MIKLILKKFNLSITRIYLSVPKPEPVRNNNESSKNAMKVIVLGTGTIAKEYFASLNTNIQVVAVVDKQKKENIFCGHEICSLGDITNLHYDKIVIAMADRSQDEIASVQTILTQLGELEVPHEKIELLCRSADASRIEYLRKLATEINQRDVEGAIAECGVFRGMFAAWINEYFPERKFYLFDTFTGFDNRDLEVENNLPEDSKATDFEKFPINRFNLGSAEAVLLRCPHRQNIIIKQGYVPDTFQGLENEKFAFVNLDMDLYKPQLEALRFFFDRITPGGVILLHDYYRDHLRGVKKAVDDFAGEKRFTCLPTRDDSTIALIPYH